MFSALHLTAEEQKLFMTLPDSVREGWRTVAIASIGTDDPRRRSLRLQLLSLHDPKLKTLQASLLNMTTTDEIVRAILDCSLSDVQEGDIAELVFAIGPVTLSAVILMMLRRAKTDEDVEDLAAMTFLRDELFTVLTTK